MQDFEKGTKMLIIISDVNIHESCKVTQTRSEGCVCCLSDYIGRSNAAYLKCSGWTA